MEACEIPRENMLPPPVVRLKIEDERCDLSCARDVAIAVAKNYGFESHLLSWFDKRGGTHSLMDECCVDGEPSWIASAEARNGNLTVDVNNEDYVFIFHQSGKFH